MSLCPHWDQKLRNDKWLKNSYIDGAGGFYAIIESFCLYKHPNRILKIIDILNCLNFSKLKENVVNLLETYIEQTYVVRV